jgi:hypothetical protein
MGMEVKTIFAYETFQEIAYLSGRQACLPAGRFTMEIPLLTLKIKGVRNDFYSEWFEYI